MTFADSPIRRDAVVKHRIENAPVRKRTLDDRIPRRSLWFDSGVRAFLVSLVVLGVLTVGSALYWQAQVLDGLSVYGPIAAVVVVAALVGVTVSISMRVRLRPVYELIARAQEVAAHRRPERLGVTADNVELHLLATTLDRMLDEIRVAFEREQAFVDDASHELRTPIAIARAELDLAQRGGLDSDTESALKSAIEELDRLEATATDLLIQARKRTTAAENLEATSVQDVASNAAEKVRRRSARTDVHLSVTGSGQVLGDAAALERCLVNLIGNAVDHCSTSVEVTVASAEELVVTIADDGPGVPETLLPDFFDRFTRGNQDREDSFGLGTAIAAEIVHAHGGTIAVTNRDKG